MPEKKDFSLDTSRNRRKIVRMDALTRIPFDLTRPGVHIPADFVFWDEMFIQK
jgi:hypothetical protein